MPDIFYWVGKANDFIRLKKFCTDKPYTDVLRPQHYEVGIMEKCNLCNLKVTKVIYFQYIVID